MRVFEFRKWPESCVKILKRNAITLFFLWLKHETEYALFVFYLLLSFLLFQGTILSIEEGKEGVIKSEAHGEIPFNVKENFSDVDFTEEDVNEEVEFTIIEV